MLDLKYCFDTVPALFNLILYKVGDTCSARVSRSTDAKLL
jgi:hypothetical protein